jgi:hypothetical protein
VLWLAGLGTTLVLAAVLSSFASDEPDGLERVAADQGFLAEADEHDLAGSPLADYQLEVGDDRVSTGAAGAAGVVVTLSVGGGLLWGLRRRWGRGGPASPPG